MSASLYSEPSAIGPKAEIEIGDPQFIDAQTGAGEQELLQAFSRSDACLPLPRIADNVSRSFVVVLTDGFIAERGPRCGEQIRDHLGEANVWSGGSASARR